MIASNESFVIVAYALTWVVLLAYLWRLRGKESRARSQGASMHPAGLR